MPPQQAIPAPLLTLPAPSLDGPARDTGSVGRSDCPGRSGRSAKEATFERVGALAPLLRLVHDGREEHVFPAVLAPGPEGKLAPVRRLAGPQDAARLAALVSGPAFAPLREAAQTLTDWCRRRDGSATDVLAPGVLRLTNTALFGAVLAEIFDACAAAPRRATATGFASVRAAQTEAALDLFLERLERDLGSSRWPVGDRWAGPVTQLWANGDETHNGGQRVLRLTLTGGARVAYKPRPAGGEELLAAAEGSLFALLNTLSGAAGPVRLPLLHAWRGSSTDPGYSWQEWLRPPESIGTLREEGPWRLTGLVLSPAESGRFWRRVGNLTAALYGLGVTDLTGENVLTGAAGDEPLMYPVDLESFACKLRRLDHSGLFPDPRDESVHHTGLENEPRWCQAGGPPLHWTERADGRLELHRRRVALLRTETRSVVGDTEGRTGYAAYLTAVLRGQFDAWSLLVRHRDRVRDFLAERAPKTYVRYIPHSTNVYSSTLGARLWPLEGQQIGAEDVEFGAAEERQLAQWDVPYFFRTADGGPLLEMEPPPGPFRAREARVDSPYRDVLPPCEDVLSADVLTLAGLGAALHDTVAQVEEELSGAGATEVEDPGHRVRLRLHGRGSGQVAFDWPEVGRRITYHWSPTKLRLELDRLPTDERTADEDGPAGEYAPPDEATAGHRSATGRTTADGRDAPASLPSPASDEEPPSGGGDERSTR